MCPLPETGNNITLSQINWFRLIKKVKDPRFEATKLSDYVLILQIGPKDLQVAILDGSDNQLLFFEDYVFISVQSGEELNLALSSLFDTHECLSAGFWKQVNICIKNNKFIQIPASLYSESNTGYLKFNARLEENAEVIKVCRNKKVDAVTVFAVQTYHLDWFSRVYANTNIRYFHQSSALIEGVMNVVPPLSDSPLYIYIDRFKLHIIYPNKGELIYYNQFLIKQFSDYVKYIMTVMKMLNLDQKLNPIVMWGYIGKSSPHHDEFVKYVKNVTFGLRPQHIKFSYLFDEIQRHHFFDLYSVPLLF